MVWKYNKDSKNCFGLAVVKVREPLTPIAAYAAKPPLVGVAKRGIDVGGDPTADPVFQSTAVLAMTPAPTPPSAWKVRSADIPTSGAVVDLPTAKVPPA